MRQYVQSTRGMLELHFLPPDAPDLNPDEFVWQHTKTNGVAKTAPHRRANPCDKVNPCGNESPKTWPTCEPTVHSSARSLAPQV